MEAETSFFLSVNYALVYRELIRAGNYGWVDPDLEQSYDSLSTSGLSELEVFLFPICQPARTNEVLSDLEAKNFQVGDLRLLLALGIEFPGEPKEGSIVALGSHLPNARGKTRVPVLYRVGLDRCLGLTSPDYIWGDLCRFLAFRSR